MGTRIQFLFPSQKTGKPNVSCPGLFLSFILIFLITVSFFVLADAQQIMFNIEESFVFSPLILRSEEFKSYFRAMIWFSRIDFRVEKPRQLLDAYLVWRSVEKGGVRT